MYRVMLKSKIHRAVVTGRELYYEGSISLDPDLMEAADLLPGEQVQVLNFSNGARLLTYTLVAERGSGTVLLNGPAARLAEVGDVVSVLGYGSFTDEEARNLSPAKIVCDSQNRMVREGRS